MDANSFFIGMLIGVAIYALVEVFSMIRNRRK